MPAHFTRRAPILAKQGRAPPFVTGPLNSGVRSTGTCLFQPGASRASVVDSMIERHNSAGRRPAPGIRFPEACADPGQGSGIYPKPVYPESAAADERAESLWIRPEAHERAYRAVAVATGPCPRVSIPAALSPRKSVLIGTPERLEIAATERKQTSRSISNRNKNGTSAIIQLAQSPCPSTSANAAAGTQPSQSYRMEVAPRKVAPVKSHSEWRRWKATVSDAPKEVRAEDLN